MRMISTVLVGAAFGNIVGHSLYLHDWSTAIVACLGFAAFFIRITVEKSPSTF